MNDLYVIIGVCIFMGLWNLMIAVLGLFPRFLSAAVGTLTDTKTKKNHRTRHGLIIPIYTRYVYTYTVKGKQYRYAAESLQSKRRLLPKATMVYVKWFPRHAYPDKFKGTTQWVMGGCFLFLGLLTMLAY